MKSDKKCVALSYFSRQNTATFLFTATFFSVCAQYYGSVPCTTASHSKVKKVARIMALQLISFVISS